MKTITPKRVVIAIGFVLMIISMRMSNDGFDYKYCRYHACPDEPASLGVILFFWIGIALMVLPVAIPWLRKQSRS